MTRQDGRRAESGTTGVVGISTLPLLDARDGAPERRPALAAALRVLLLLALFVVVDRAVLRLGALPEASYFEPLLLAELAARPGVPLLLACAVALVLLARRGALLARWSDLGGEGVRGVVVFLAAVLAWPLVTTGYNPYFEQSHLVDAAVAVALVVLTAWRPLFILFLLPLLAGLLLGLKVPPMGGSILAHKLQIFHVLTLFGAALLLHAATGARVARLFLFMAACMVAGSYFTAAVAKLELGWWYDDQLYLLPVSAFGHGWLHPLGAEGVARLSELLRPFDLTMRLAVLVLEAGCLLFLLHRFLAVGLLSGLIVFHLGVVALYGFVFWTWILLDAALIVALLRNPGLLGRGREAAVLGISSIILIATAVYWARPPYLGWYDTGLSYSYRFEGIGASGRHYELHPSYFSPYEDVFTMTAFSYLSSEHHVLTGAYGVTHRDDIRAAIAAARSAEEVLELEERIGSDRFRPERYRTLVAFVERFVAARNQRDPPLFDPSWLAPPPQFISLRPGVSDTAGDPLREVRVYEVTTRFDDHGPEAMRRIEIARILIGGDAGSGGGSRGGNEAGGASGSTGESRRGSGSDRGGGSGS